MTEPLRFAFAVHFHQPVGNFDHVIEQHVREAYAPFLERVAERGFLPLTVHVSGPLLEWLAGHAPSFLERLGGLVADGRVELLSSGFDEPVLAALTRADRADQLARMRDVLARRFGVSPEGAWLTERVWEPDLAADLAAAGLRYTLVDDRHFLVTGMPRERLHAPFRTESDGRALALLPIDERLRYLIPFKPAAETVAYLRDLRSRGHALAVLGDDAEKFGGWPHTREWVYERGWLDGFLAAMAGLAESGEVRLVTCAQAVAEAPGAGLVYLPSASYREMEAWALPPDAGTRLARLERDLGAERMAGADGALVRGAHWRNFFVRYPEANRMHKKAQALSTLCRARGDPPAARASIGHAQCNDAYWHGVFGGLYLPHLRRAVWHHLAAAERVLRAGEALAAEPLDLDGDGDAEIWIHSAAFSAVVSPARGGAVEEYTLFEPGLNYADVLTRRREAYHDAATAPPGAPGGDADAAPSIHDLERRLRLAARPSVDPDDRAIFVDRVLAPDLPLEAYRAGDVRAAASWARARLGATLERSDGAVTVTCRAPDGSLEKRLRFDAAGALRAAWRWRPGAYPPGATFASELSLAHPLALAPAPEAEVWSFPVTTVSKSERGLEETTQGQSVTPRWPAAAGAAALDLTPG